MPVTSLESLPFVLDALPGEVSESVIKKLAEQLLLKGQVRVAFRTPIGQFDPDQSSEKHIGHLVKSLALYGLEVATSEPEILNLDHTGLRIHVTVISNVLIMAEGLSNRSNGPGGEHFERLIGILRTGSGCHVIFSVDYSGYDQREPTQDVLSVYLFESLCTSLLNAGFRRKTRALTILKNLEKSEYRVTVQIESGQPLTETP